MTTGYDGLRQTRSTIIVTPLVDVLLVLLIIFIMVTPILAKAIDSSIPREATQPLPEEYAERQLVLYVCADGRLLLNREELQASTLPQRLREIFAQRGGEALLFLDADEETGYGTVVEIMDLCRDGGAQTIGVVPDSIGSPIKAGF